VDNLHEAFVKACRRVSILEAARSLVRPSEEQLRHREEQDRKFAMIALGVYTKKYNMQVISISTNNYCSGYFSMTVLAVLVNIATSILFLKWACSLLLV
jgi:hypothetical protein